MLANISKLRHDLVINLKRAIHGNRGEPYRFCGRTLRFIPGTRPVRQKYSESSNAVVRFDARQINQYTDMISAGDVVFDVGGHFGQCAILMACLAGPTGSVITFEPDPSARESLLGNINLNAGLADIRVEPLAISDMVGKADFFDGQGNANSSLCEVGSVVDAPSILVDTMTLDEYVTLSGVGTVSLVKIDIEGAEIHALRGATKLLQSDCEFLVELHPYAWDEFGVKFDELLAMAEATNRDLYYLGEKDPLVANPEYGTVILRKRDHVRP